MAITERIKHLINNASESRDNENELFLPREVFRRIIDRERERANRTGDVFSMVVFMLPDNKERPNELRLLAEAIAPRVRSIDAAGWFDSQHVGLLLPETNQTGACHLVGKICREIRLVQTPPRFEIVVYPSAKFTDPGEEESHPSSERENYQRSSPLWVRWRFNQSSSVSDYSFGQNRGGGKRAFDILGATVFLLIFSPLFLVIPLVIKSVSSGPVFYRQQRIGYAGQPFTFLKFRTMRTGAETHNHQAHLVKLIKDETDENGSGAPMTKLDGDPQIIPCGNLIRKSCLDELPQLINVLRGEMSLVGPRPPIPYEVKEYLPWHRGRFNAIPGMTGLWQVSGKNKLSFRDMVRLDICYIRGRSLWVDTKILFRTPLAILDQLRGSLKKENSIINEGARKC